MSVTGKAVMIALVAAAGMAMLACPQPARTTGGTTPPAAPGAGGSGGGNGGGGETPTTPAEKSWTISAADFGDDSEVYVQYPNRSAPYAWDGITADQVTAGKVRVSIAGHEVPLDDDGLKITPIDPVFADRTNYGVEWTVKAEVSAGQVVLVLEAPDQSDEVEESGGDAVARIEITEEGTGYTTLPTVTFTAPQAADGVRATGVATTGIASVTVSYGGTDGTYQSPPTVSFLDGGNPVGSGTELTVNLVRRIYDVRIDTPGHGYTTAPTVSFSGGGGSGAVATAFLQTGVHSVNITANGSGYTSATAVTFAAPPSGTDRTTGTAVISGGTVTGVTVVNAGSGYSRAGSPPAITFTDSGGGTGAAATAVFQSGVSSVAVTNGGSGYSYTPLATVGFTAPPTGTGNAAPTGTVLMQGTVPTTGGVTIQEGGSGYTSVPTVSFSGDGANRASGTATLETMVTSIEITNPGSGYTSAPTISIPAPTSGTTATATAELTEKIVVRGNDSFQNLYFARLTLNELPLQVRIVDE